MLLKNNIPTSSDSLVVLADKLATIHNEFNVVHPFRDGNGRTIRLFLDLLVNTLGFEPINYGDRAAYLTACVAGAKANHQPMQEVVQKGLTRNSGLYE